jgi:polysaccharide biosynthesis protein PslG
MATDTDGSADRRRPKRAALVGIGLALVVAGVLAALLIPGSSSTAPASADRLFGIVSGGSVDSTDREVMVDSGVGSVRFLLSWPVIEPRKGSFNWFASDQMVGGLASHGIQPVPFAFGSPNWVSPGVSHPPLDSAADQAAWADFLKAAVERYGPGGSYWSTEYEQHFGDGAEPLPVTAWQIWNEPNLPHYFAPASSPPKYAQLLRISHDAIKDVDPKAEIVLAGMPGYGKPDTAWKFLDELYRQPGFARDFDAVALHPYARTVGQLRTEIEKLRNAIAKHGDGQMPLWLTELGWGSGKSNRFGLNKGPAGQERMLSRSFELILDRRATWRVERLFWFDWRDPPPGSPVACSFCATAGLLEYNHAPKPALNAYKRFATGGGQQ